MNANTCGLCDDDGWQRFEISCPTFGTSRIVARACGCDAAPQTERDKRRTEGAPWQQGPLVPPDWARDGKGVWLPQNMKTVIAFPCNCIHCKPWMWPDVPGKGRMFQPTPEQKARDRERIQEQLNQL